MQPLFIYGTLMRGEERDGLLLGHPVVPATTRGVLWRVPAGYPALETDAGAKTIHGELVSLPDTSLFTLLDLYEGVADGLYDRVQIPVQTAEGGSLAWAYTMSPLQLRRAGCTRLNATDWRALQRRV